MHSRFIRQPSIDGEQAGSELSSLLQRHMGGSFHAVVAWAKSSGLSRVEDDIRAFRAAGGGADLIVGLDANGATWEGLALALDVFDTVHVFHDPGTRTFHPKLYIGHDAASASILVGSHNLTAGGLYNNYEAGVALELDLSIGEDANALADVLAYRQWFLDAAPRCIQLTRQLLESWRESPPVAIGSEKARSHSGAGAPPSTSAFGAPIAGLPSAPATPSSGEGQGPGDIAATTGNGSKDLPAPAVEVQGVGEDGDPVIVVRRWTKELPRSDAQQPSTGSNPTGNLRLTKAGHPIDWRTFFRHDLFSTADWITTSDGSGQPIERASVEFTVTVGGQASTHTLTVSHAPHREADQANHTTVLHWGTLMPRLTATDHTGDYVAISRHSDGSFGLEITSHDPGPIT